MDADLLSFILRSKVRRVVLSKLGKGVATPSMLSSSLNLDKTHVSRALKELSERDLVKMLTSSRKGRLYDITSRGESILKELEELRI